MEDSENNKHIWACLYKTELLPSGSVNNKHIWVCLYKNELLPSGNINNKHLNLFVLKFISDVRLIKSLTWWWAEMYAHSWIKPIVWWNHKLLTYSCLETRTRFQRICRECTVKKRLFTHDLSNQRHALINIRYMTRHDNAFTRMQSRPILHRWRK